MRRDPRIDLLRTVPGLNRCTDRALNRLAPLFDECEVASVTCLVFFKPLKGT